MLEINTALCHKIGTRNARAVYARLIDVLMVAYSYGKSQYGMRERLFLVAGIENQSTVLAYDAV